MAETGHFQDIEVISLGEMRFALRKDGKFASAEPGKALVLFDRNNIGPWETFACYDNDEPRDIIGTKFDPIPMIESGDFYVFNVEEFVEHLEPPLTNQEDLDWYESSALHFYPVRSGRYEQKMTIARTRSKVMSTIFPAHSALFDRSGFLNNYGFIYRKRDDFTRLSIDPTTHKICADVGSIFSNSFIQGTYLLAFDGNSFNYYHFVIDGLAHLLHMKRSGLKYPPIICVEGDLLRWQKEYFELMDQEAILLIDGKSRDLVAVEEVYYIKTVGLPHVSKSVICALASKIKSAARIDSSTAPFRRIYIKRKPGQRSVTNQDELETFLKKFGFEAVDLDGLPVSSQVALFAESQVVIGPHGAGLVNLIYCTPGALLIDLIPGDGEVRNFFWLLATKVGVKYSFVRCNASNGYGGGLSVDLSQIEATLKATGIT